jgi:hypothetical protein
MALEAKNLEVIEYQSLLNYIEQTLNLQNDTIKKNLDEINQYNN